MRNIEHRGVKEGIPCVHRFYSRYLLDDLTHVSNSYVMYDCQKQEFQTLEVTLKIGGAQ